MGGGDAAAGGWWCCGWGCGCAVCGFGFAGLLQEGAGWLSRRAGLCLWLWQERSPGCEQRPIFAGAAEQLALQWQQMQWQEGGAAMEPGL